MNTTEAVESVAPAWLVFIDVETTGLLPGVNGLLSIGAYHPWSRERFYLECRPVGAFKVDAEAMRVNGQRLEEVCEREMDDFRAVGRLFDWLDKLRGEHGVSKFVMAGKNPEFDRKWLGGFGILERGDYILSRRMIDVHACALALAAARGLDAPAMRIAELYKALGLPEEPEPHNAVNGAFFAWLALAKIGAMTGVFTGAGNGKTTREGVGPA